MAFPSAAHHRYPTLGLPSSLRDEFAQPEQVGALLLSREGVIDPAQVQARTPRTCTPAQRVWTCEPWVRQSLAVQELMDPLTWTCTSLAGEVASEVVLGVRSAAGVRSLPTGTSLQPAISESGTTFVRLQRPPPSLFESELAQVLAYADLRAERMSEMLTQIDGQWAHWGSILPLRPDRTPHTLALLTVALQWAIAVELRFKYWLGCPRPMALSAQVQPCITTPGHGSFPMGHAVQAFLVSSLLQTLSGRRSHDAWGVQLTRTAFRISVNRVVAGLHFPVDLVAGMILGKALAHYVQRVAQPHATHRPWHPVDFEPARYLTLGPLGGLQDSERVWRAFEQSTQTVPWDASATQATAPVWTTLWQAAAQEWVQGGVA